MLKFPANLPVYKIIFYFCLNTKDKGLISGGTSKVADWSLDEGVQQINFKQMKKLTILIIVLVVLGFTFSMKAQEINKNEEMKPALLVIDVQKTYFKKMDQSAVEKPIKVINDATQIFNEYELPIIYIYHRNNTSEKFQFIDEISVPENATKIVKQYGSAFINTELDNILKELDCNTLFLCGLSATACVKATYLGAKELDFNTYLIKDASMSPSHKKTKKIEEEFDTMSLETVHSLLTKMK